MNAFDWISLIVIFSLAFKLFIHVFPIVKSRYPPMTRIRMGLLGVVGAFLLWFLTAQLFYKYLPLRTANLVTFYVGAYVLGFGCLFFGSFITYSLCEDLSGRKDDL